MFDLDLSRCPICQTQRRLIRQAREVKGQHFIWYECPECGSALMWMGGDRWIYQKVGRPDRQYLARRPLTTVELHALSAVSAPPAAAPAPLRQETPPKAGPDWLHDFKPAQAEPTFQREEPPPKAEPDWLSALRPAQAEPAYYGDEPQAADGSLPAYQAYKPEPIAAPAPLPAETPAAARPKGAPRSLLIAVAVIAILCVIAAVVILLTQG